jgi:DNA-binding phage protein
MTIEIAPWDTAETLKTKEDIADYLEAVLEDGDTDLIRKALGNIARTVIAKEAGLPPLPDDPLKALSIVIKTLGIRLSVHQAAE